MFTVCSTLNECETTDRNANILTYIAISEPISKSNIFKPRTFAAIRGVWDSSLVVLEHRPRNKLLVAQADW